MLEKIKFINEEPNEEIDEGPIDSSDSTNKETSKPENLENGVVQKSLYELDDYLSLSEEQKNELDEIKKRLLNSSTNINRIIHIKNIFSEKIINSQEIQGAIELFLLEDIKRRTRYYTYDVSAYNNPQNKINGLQILIREIKETFNLPEETIVEAIKQGLIMNFQNDDIKKTQDYFKKIKETFNLPEETIVEAIKQGVINDLKNWRKNIRPTDTLIKEIKREFNVSEEIFNSPDIQETAKQTILEVIMNNSVLRAMNIQEEFNVPEEIFNSPDIQEIAIKKILTLFLQTNPLNIKDRQTTIEDIVRIVKKFNIKKENILNIFHALIFKILEEGYGNLIDKLSFLEQLKIVLISDTVDMANIINLQEIQVLAGEKMAEHLLNENVDFAIKIKEYFLKTKSSEDIIKKVFYNSTKDNRWNVVVKIGLQFIECKDIYKNFVEEQRQIAENINLPFSERKIALDILSQLIISGADYLNEEFSKIISKTSKQKESINTKWGLDGIQESALYTLIRLDNPDSNSILFSLLNNDHINNTIKIKVLRKLISKKRNFLNKELKDTLHTWIKSVPYSELDWHDMDFINEMLNNIPSTETRNKSTNHASFAIDGILNNNFRINKYWQESFSNISKNAFLQLYEFCSGDTDILKKFNSLYLTIRNDSTEKNNLLYCIVNCLEVDKSILSFTINKLNEFDWGINEEDSKKLVNFFKKILFFDKIESCINYNDEDYYDDNNDYYNNDYEKNINRNETQTENKEIKDLSEKNVNNFDELNKVLEDYISKKIQEIFNNRALTSEKLEAITNNWSDIEPILTYLRRYPNLNNYISEMFINFDNLENWQNWRYDQKNSTVKNQVGFLKDIQLEKWKENYIIELDNIETSETNIDKASQISTMLKDATVTDHHIYDPENGFTKDKLISDILTKYYEEIGKNPNKKSDIADNLIEKCSSYAKAINTLIRYNNIKRIDTLLNSLFLSGSETLLSAKFTNILDGVLVYLSKESVQNIKEKLSKYKQGEKIKIDEILDNEIRNELNKKSENIKQNFEKLKQNEEALRELNLDQENFENPGVLYQKRNEIESLLHLIRLDNLNPRLIATNRLIDSEKKKDSITISKTIEDLKKYFKGSALLQNINSLEMLLAQENSIMQKRRLAAIFTDEPEILWQVGMYPLGSGSCQNYAEGSYAHNLMGYVGDANVKAAYIIDLNELPEDIKEELNKEGLNMIKNKIKNLMLLQASLARSMIKLGKDKDNKPVIVIEPTYTSVNKGNFSFDKYFNIFLDMFIADPMNAKMARGGGQESVETGYSRSPEGQYEDLNLSSLKIINKEHKPSKKEKEIIERMRSSV